MLLQVENSRRELGGCQSLVREFVERIESLIRENLKTGYPATIPDVLREAASFLVERGGCRYEFTSYEKLYDEVARLALDSSMEALSHHIEKLDSSLYNILAVTLTQYATHIVRIVTIARRIASTTPSLQAYTYKALEPLLFAALARLIATAMLVQKTESEQIPLILPGLKKLVENFISEENNMLQGVIELLVESTS